MAVTAAMAGACYLRAESGINTLADFRIRGPSARCTARQAAAATARVEVAQISPCPVPVGTVVQRCRRLRRVIGDLTSAGQSVLVARGRQGRLGQHALQEQHESLAAPVRLGTAR